MIEDALGIVIDTGSQSTKAGFAGDSSPRVVFPTTVARFRCPGLADGFPLVSCGAEAIKNRGVSNLLWPVQEGLVQDWNEMEKLWHYLFYNQLCIPPESTKVMYAMHPLVPTEDMEKIAEILFESFTVQGLYMPKSPALALYASGRTTGVVWENGYACSYVAPVFEGFHLMHSTVTCPITGKMLTLRLQKLLKDLGYSFTTPYEFDLMEQIKNDLCYVALDYEKELRESVGIENKVKYDLPDGQHIMLGEERFQVAEAMFQPVLAGYKCKNLAESVLASIDLCDIDFRKKFLGNIVFSGGSSVFPGIVERFTQELTYHLRAEAKPKVDPIAMREDAAWRGGSMLASMPNLKGFWLTREEYEDTGSDRVKYKFY